MLKSLTNILDYANIIVLIIVFLVNLILTNKHTVNTSCACKIFDMYLG